MNVVLFEDASVEQLSPITLLRPAYSITCGALRLVDLAKSLGNVCGVVRPELAEFQADYFDTTFDSSKPSLFLNARLVPDAAIVTRLKERIAMSEQDGSSWHAAQDGTVAAAFVEAGGVPDITTTNRETLAEFLGCQLPATQLEAKLFNYPHDVIASHGEIIGRNLEFRLRQESWQQCGDRVFASSKMELPPNVVFETEKGPVLIDEGAAIGAFSVLRGPLYLGKHVSVSPQSLLKGPVCVGHDCKVGGEVSNATIEPYSNKVHFGYLGTSYVGSWVNLGAGTSNSNLKNTYGSIRMKYGEETIDTGEQFLGCVIGDFSKTAIHTAIYTGKLVGVCSNIYGVVTQNVPSFANYARSFGDVTEHPAEVMKTTQKRVFSRRAIEQEERHIRLLREVYARESANRELSDQPPSL